MSFPFGVHANIPNADYHADEAISSTYAKVVYKQTIAHAQVLNQKLWNSTAMDIGSAVHGWALEGVVPFKGPDTRRGKEWAEAKKTAELAGTVALTTSDFMRVEKMVNALFNSPTIHELLLNKERKIEVSMFAKHASELRIKCRPDLYFNSTVCDIKTTVSAEPFTFEKQMHGLGYNVQAAWYFTVMRLCGLTPDRFLFLNVEKEPPFATSIVEVSQDLMEYSLAQVERIINEIQQAKKTNKYHTGWPEFYVANLPAWAV